MFIVKYFIFSFGVLLSALMFQQREISLISATSFFFIFISNA